MKIERRSLWADDEISSLVDPLQSSRRLRLDVPYLDGDFVDEDTAELDPLGALIEQLRST